MRIIEGDCLKQLKNLDDNSVDAVVTDPPYGFSKTDPKRVAETLSQWVSGDVSFTPGGKGFMGKDWDSFVPPPAVWKECLRVLKPGGHMVVFAGSRTQDLMGLSIRLAGFEIRDTIGWIYGSGFPKSMDISKAIDKGQGKNRQRQLEFTEWMRSTGITAREIDETTGTNIGNHYLTDKSQPAIATADLFDKLRPLLPEVPERIERLVAERTGIEWTDYVKREVVGKQKGATSGWSMDGTTKYVDRNITTPATDDSARWNGWGTSLKPAIEPIILARKPLDGTVANNVLAHGVGGLNINACRVQTDDNTARPNGVTAIWQEGGTAKAGIGGGSPAGRFPANVLLDEHAAAEMDKQSGHSVSRVKGGVVRDERKKSESIGAFNGEYVRAPLNNSGGASRFFPVFKYQAKAPKKERPVIEREDGSKIVHPTVKPVELMEWLVTLITPPGGTVLDPFAGTGTTLQAANNKGFDAIGIEADPDYVQLAHARLANSSAVDLEKEEEE